MILATDLHPGAVLERNILRENLFRVNDIFIYLFFPQQNQAGYIIYYYFLLLKTCNEINEDWRIQCATSYPVITWHLIGPFFFVFFYLH